MSFNVIGCVCVCLVLVPPDMVCGGTQSIKSSTLKSVNDGGAPIRQILLSPVTIEDENGD